MSGFLLDTNIISEARKGKRANPKFCAWFETVNEGDLFLSVLVLGEIRKGVEQIRSPDPTQARMLERWLNGLERIYAERILPITPAIADQWGRFGAMRPISTVDGLLAATAMVHGLSLVTRNAQHVAHTGVNLLNPFDQ